MEFSDPLEEVNRVFISKELSELTLDELYEQLDTLRKARLTKDKRDKKRSARKRQAKEILDLENIVPPAMKDMVRKMSPEKRRKFIQLLAKDTGKKV